MSLLKTVTRWFTDGSQHVFLHADTGNGAPSKVQMDRRTGSLLVVDPVTHEIHAGNAYKYSDPTTLEAAASQDYLITTPDTTKLAHLQYSCDGTAITSFFLYEATDKTGPTAQTIFNADRNSTNTATITVHKGTSGGSTDGTLLKSYASGTATGSSRSNGTAIFGTERILKRNTKYIFRITSGTAGNLCNVKFEWAEITDWA